MTAWLVLLMFATTTYPSVSATMRSISASGAKHGRHGAVVAHRQIRHLAAPGADRLQRGVEGQRTGGDQSAVFAEAVAHHHVRAHAVRVEQAGQRQVGGQHRRLGDLGLHELLFEPLRGGLVGVVREDVLGQRLAEQRRHDPVGLVERRGDERLPLAQVAQHVDVLRALAGVEERDLWPGAPRPTKTPWARSIFHMAGLPPRSACTALPALAARSPASA